MYGTRLEVETHIVTGVATALANVAKCVQRAGLEVEEMVLEPLASAQAVSTPSERDLGVVVADLGGGTTSLAVFANGGLCHTAILPVGGAHLTNDIAVGMRTPMAEAEKLKIRWGAASPNAVSEGEMIEVFSVGGRQPRVLPRRVLANSLSRVWMRSSRWCRGRFEEAGTRTAFRPASCSPAARPSSTVSSSMPRRA
jgi:cell division protein FtsA